jgi:hypothetical protein
VESFSDIEAHAGTCYRAAGWKPAGISKGFAKHRGDHYTFHGRPKQLWLRLLRKKAIAWLRAPHLPKRYEAGATAAAHGQMPLNAPHMRSLAEALRPTPDPRASNRHYPLGALLTRPSPFAGRKVLFRGSDLRFALYIQGCVFQNGLWGRPCPLTNGFLMGKSLHVLEVS